MNEVEPLVSIALATYNGNEFLSSQLDSLLAQDYSNLEIVISDDCSTDGTWEILQSYAKKDRRIRLLLRDRRHGYVENFYRAFSECQGNFIAPSDQDDIWYPTKISRLVSNIGCADLIYCNNRFVDSAGRPLGKILSDTISMISGCDPRNLLFCTSICGHAMLFRKNLLQDLPNPNFVPYIDWAIAFLAANRNGILYLDEVLVDWRQHSSSTSAHVRDQSRGSRNTTLMTDISNIRAFSSHPGKEQSFMIEAREKFESWLTSYFNLSMFFFVLQHGHITHKAHPARFPSLKYLFGYKLKKILRPYHY